MISLLIFLVSFNIAIGQAFYHLEFGRSSAAIGTGEQNLTLLDPVNAMAGNPANLIFEKGATVSFFRNPLYFFQSYSTPVTNIVGSLNYQNKNFFGLEYSSFYLGKEKLFDQYGNVQKEYENYEKTFSLGYAQKLNDKLSLGTKITYAISRGNLQATHLMFSAGLSYNEKLFGKDLNLGMSFMHFGDKVKVKSEVYGEFYGENPSLLLVGFNYNLLSFYPGKITSLIEFKKELISHTNGVPDNSIKAFYKSWKKFDLFLTTEIGFILSSNPVRISNRLNFSTNYFIGYSTNRYSGEFYNYGMQISLSYNDYALALGFGGRWFSARTFLRPYVYGYETFDFTLNKKINWNSKEHNYSDGKLVGTNNLSFGFGLSNSLPLGIWKKNYHNSLDMSTDNFLSFDFDFEIKLNSYISNIITISYWNSNSKFTNNSQPIYDFDESAYAILTGLNFYPFNELNNYYISTKIGVLRLNPIPANVFPKYSNVPIIVFSSGYKLNLFSLNFQIIPYVNLVTFFRDASDKDIVLGFKKFDYGLKLGYRL